MMMSVDLGLQAPPKTPAGVKAKQHQARLLSDIVIKNQRSAKNYSTEKVETSMMGI